MSWRSRRSKNTHPKVRIPILVYFLSFQYPFSGGGDVTSPLIFTSLQDTPPSPLYLSHYSTCCCQTSLCFFGYGLCCILCALLTSVSSQRKQTKTSKQSSTNYPPSANSNNKISFSRTNIQSCLSQERIKSSLARGYNNLARGYMRLLTRGKVAVVYRKRIGVESFTGRFSPHCINTTCCYIWCRDRRYCVFGVKDLCYVFRCDSFPMGEMAWPSCVCPWSVFPGFKYGLGTRGCEILSLVMGLGGEWWVTFSHHELGYAIVYRGDIIRIRRPG